MLLGTLFMFSFFFFNDTAPPEIYTLSLTTLFRSLGDLPANGAPAWSAGGDRSRQTEDRKSTRLNSSHVAISYAVFCLKKKTIHHRDEPGLVLVLSGSLSATTNGVKSAYLILPHTH